MAALVLLMCGCLPTPADASMSSASIRPMVGNGAWTWPLWPQPSVEQHFDAPDGPYAAGHRGVDLLGRSGQAVRAVDEGTVAYAGRVGGVGVVSLDTAEGRVTYQPVAPSVRRGAVVPAGAVLGHLVTTGGHCLPRACLHLGLIVAGEYKDPLRPLGGGPVRLLPLDDAARGPTSESSGTEVGRGRASPSSRPFLSPVSADSGSVSARLGVSVPVTAAAVPSTSGAGQGVAFAQRTSATTGAWWRGLV